MSDEKSGLHSVVVLRFWRVMKGEQTVDWVEIANRAAYNENGQLSHSTNHRVNALRPPEHHGNDGKMLHMRAIWSVVGPAYDAWLRNEAPPEEGTPLAQWPGITAEQAEVLKKAKIRTVEDVAALGDDLVSRLPLPGARDLRKQARLWLQGSDKEEMNRKFAELEAKYEAALTMLEQQQQQQEAKPKRGRPPKADASEASETSEEEAA